MKIQLKAYDKEMSAEIPDDSNIADVIEILSGLLVGIGFSTKLVGQCINIPEI